MRGVTVRPRPQRRRGRVAVRSLGLLLVGALLPLLAAELLLRLLPVSAGNAKRAVSVAEPVPRYPAGSEIVWSLGWDFERVVRKRTNGHGFFSEVEYGPSTEPVLALIGDSYVEAMQVANADALDGVLRRRADARGRIYSFGVSGAPLSQYLAFADFARRRFAPAAMVFVVVGNDFDESHERYRTSAGGAVFVEDARSGRLELATVEHRASALRRLARGSALLRYLTFNARVDWQGLGERLAGGWRGAASPMPSDGPRWVGQTEVAADAERIASSLRVLDRFFELLPEKTGLAPDRVAFLLDGMRPDLYSPAARDAAERSYFARMRRELVTRARRGGYEVVDLQPAFLAHFERDGGRFEIAGDGHWNERGHAVAAEALARSALWRTFVRGVATGDSIDGPPSSPSGLLARSERMAP